LANVVFLLFSAVNEHDPTFASATETTSISEDVSIHTLVFTVAATDDDDGIDGRLQDGLVHI